MEYPVDYTPLRPGGLSLTRQLLSMAGQLKNRRVLDLGCGKGGTVWLLSHEYGADVTGVDLSADLISECRQKYPGITFMKADARDLPFEDSSFDILISECSFSVFPQPNKALMEANRVLVAGGKLLVSDLWKCGDVNGGSGMVRNLYSRKTWFEMIENAGFDVKEFSDARGALTEMYVQMIFDLGREDAQKKMGLCLQQQDMKKVSYMLMAAEKTKR